MKDRRLGLDKQRQDDNLEHLSGIELVGLRENTPESQSHYFHSSGELELRCAGGTHSNPDLFRIELPPRS